MAQTLRLIGSCHLFFAAAGVIHLATGYAGRDDALRESFDVYFGTELDTSTHFAYYANLRLANLTQTGGSGAPVAPKHAAFTYGDDGRIETINRYAAATADPSKLVVTSTYGYDPANRLVGLTHAQGAELLAGYAFSYDKLSRITNATSLDGTVEYAYDDSSQVTGANYNYVAAANSPNEAFAYDDNGNWMANGAPAWTANRPAGDGTYSYLYDAEGNRTRRTLNATGDYEEYRWDHRQRLVGVDSYQLINTPLGGVLPLLVGSIDYAYDYLDRLVKRTVTPAVGSAVAEHYVYDGDHLILRLDSTGDVLDRYLWAEGVDQLLADEQFPGQTAEALLWTLLDQRGSALDLAEYDAGTNATDIVMHRVYNAFGSLASETESAGSLDPSAVDFLFGFTGSFRDADTGLQNHLHRWYDPALHQWLSEAPLGFEAGDVNTRRYVGNDPVNKIDPTGLADITVRVPKAKVQTPGVVDPASGSGEIPGKENVYWATDYPDLIDKIVRSGYQYELPIGTVEEPGRVRMFDSFGGGVVSMRALREAAELYSKKRSRDMRAYIELARRAGLSDEDRSNRDGDSTRGTLGFAKGFAWNGPVNAFKGYVQIQFVPGGAGRMAAPFCRSFDKVEADVWKAVHKQFESEEGVGEFGFMYVTTFVGPETLAGLAASTKIGGNLLSKVQLGGATKVVLEAEDIANIANRANQASKLQSRKVFQQIDAGHLAAKNSKNQTSAIVLDNAADGAARELRVHEKLSGHFQEASVQRERLLRTADGKKVHPTKAYLASWS